MFKKIKSFSKFLVILIFIYFIYSIGFYIGAESKPAVDKISGIDNKESQIENVDFDLFWRTWAEVEKKYVDRADINREDMVLGAITGMVNSLDDPYTTFFKPESAKIFKEDINGSFSGIGAEIGFRDGALTIISPLKGSPAEKSGLKSGDIVTMVDDKSTMDMSLEEAVTLIRGPQGEDVVLKIFREGLDDLKDITITRNVIDIPTIESEVKEGNIGYIKLYNFTGDASQLFRESVLDLKKQGAERFIVDLRNNPGGFLGASIEISSTVVPGGDVVVVEKFGNGEGNKNYRSKGYQSLENTPLVVLINGGSASASEIFAGAVKGKDKTKIIGTQSFGKGSVQEVVDITSHTFLKVTVAKWLTPDGTSIQDGGITPDIEVKIPEDAKLGDDIQLDKAIEVVKEL